MERNSLRQETYRRREKRKDKAIFKIGRIKKPAKYSLAANLQSLALDPSSKGNRSLRDPKDLGETGTVKKFKMIDL